MKLNDEQYKALEQYERHFSTAVNARWSRNPGTRALQVISSIYREATGDSRHTNFGCQTCILHLLQDCGRLYFAEKEARSSVKNEEPTVEGAGKASTTKGRAKGGKTTKKEKTTQDRAK